MRQFVLLSAALATAMPNPAWARDGAAAPFTAGRDPAALECLTQAIYYEARNQSDDGQRAVAQVVLNRSRHPNYPSSICGVVFQGSERSTGCQFSFTCDGSMNGGIDERAWARAERIAAAALRGSVYRPVGLALNYHTTAILPYWAPSLVQQAVVGDHIFYRLPGSGPETLGPQQVERVERADEPAWSARDSAVLRRTLRPRPTSPRLQTVGMAIMEIPVEEQPVRFRTLSGRPSAQSDRAPRRRASTPRRSGPRVAIEGGVRVARGS
ncbi:cell wall hydrolase [Sphingosinicella sp.]|uniref:cell wall hydrolase n=1 Tax=Sphingosinicella sp. TaxID=1917971 RepID=UPI004037FB9D